MKRTIPELIGRASRAWLEVDVARDMEDYAREALALLPTATEVGTGALLARLKPEHTQKEYFALVSLLQQVRKRPSAAPLWRKTGKTNRYGKPALVWIAQSPEAVAIAKDEAAKHPVPTISGIVDRVPAPEHFGDLSAPPYTRSKQLAEYLDHTIAAKAKSGAALTDEERGYLSWKASQDEEDQF